MSRANGALTVNQSSASGIINWKSFSVGKSNSVDFDNHGGATLNRVSGGNLSRIEGSLTSNGSVYVMNSAGVLVGKTGRVNTDGSFVATSGNFESDAFGVRKMAVNGAKGAVTNRGSITSRNGDVMLIGNSADNEGTISAKKGTAALGAGTSVEIAPAGSAARIAVVTGTGNASNSGSIAAASAELRAANGNVYALAGNNGGIIRATGTNASGGHIWLTSAGGSTTVEGTLNASGAKNAAGSIETSGAKLNLHRASIDAGQNGQWLLDPTNISVGATAASDIARTLNKGTNVSVNTTKSGSRGPGHTSSGNGDITVNSEIKWSTTAKLTLDAYHSIDVNKLVHATGKGGVTLETNDGGSHGALLFNGHGRIAFGSTSSALTVNGNKYTLVNSIAALAKAVAKSDDGFYALTKDLSAKANGTYKSAPIGELTGIFEGLGHTIDDLSITDKTDADNVGLFETVGRAGVVRDLNLTGVALTGGDYANVGGIAGQVLGKLLNDTASGTATAGSNASVGVLAGRVYQGVIENSTASGKSAAAGQANIGGLVGNAQYSTIEGSSASVAISDTNDALGADYSTGNLGGLVGNSIVSTVEDSTASGSITIGVHSYFLNVGGLVGYSSGIIKDSHASTKISSLGSDDLIGGLVGESDDLIEGSSASGAISADSTGNESVGGLAGVITGRLTTSHASSQITGGTWDGGLVELNNGTITDSHATGSIIAGSGTSAAGGLAAYSVGAISNSYATGNVATKTDSGYAGGLVGNSGGSTISESYATGNVSAAGSSFAGGLVGQDNATNISKSYATGNVTAGASGQAGGLLGYVYFASVKYSYATGAVKTGSDGYAGGLLGATYSSQITQVYSTGAVTGGSGATLGGLAGYSDADSSFANSYWDTTTSKITGASHGVGNRASESGVTGLSDASLKSGLPSGFNSSVWKKATSIQSGLPYIITLKSSY